MADYAPNTHQDNGGTLMSFDFEELAIAVAAAAAYGKTIVLMGRFTRVSLELSNTGAKPLTDCIVEYQAHPNSSWATFITAAELTAGSAAAGLDLIVGDPPALAGPAKSLMVIDVTGLWSIRLVVKAAAPADNTTVDIRGTAGR
jgi:hypothetical protein